MDELNVPVKLSLYEDVWTNDSDIIFPISELNLGGAVQEHV